jgi:protein-disulfide isomerase
MPKLQKFLIASIAFILLSASCAPQSTPTVEVNLTVPTIVEPTPLPCRSFGAAPTPGPDAPSIFPPITEADHKRGPENSAVTIMVYGDFQDVNSALFFGVVGRLMAEHPNDIQLISRPFPLIGRNDKAVLPRRGWKPHTMQGKFWEMHDLLYSQQENWAGLSA